MTDLTFRTARPDDAAAVASLHADSWQRHYRGAYGDAFLDRQPDGYLTEMWTKRLGTPTSETHTILAESGGELIGLAHTMLGKDPTYGALVDNLHVRAALKRQGIGTQLLALTAEALHDAAPSSGLYLWVLEQNTAAQAFYEARGGIRADRQHVPPPGGDPANLNGTPSCFRYTWADPSVLA